jgi:hypothetical protein
MWLCTDWAYNAEAVAAWGTWAAVVVALGVAVASMVARWWQRRVEARLLAVLLFHEVSHAYSILQTVGAHILPDDRTGIAEATFEADAAHRQMIAARVERIRLPSVASSVNRLSVLPSKAAIAVGEMQSNLSFLGQGGAALAAGNKPPPAFYPEFCSNLRACLRTGAEARLLLMSIAFPKGRTMKGSEAAAVE